MTPEQFIQQTAEDFGFLVSDHGFDLPEAHTHAPEAWAVFRRDRQDVTVHFELGGEVWVVLSERMGNSREACDLRFLLARHPDLCSEDEITRGSVDCSEMLRLLAGHLAQVATNFLRGVPGTLTEFCQEARDAVRKRERALFGEVDGE